MKIDKIDDKIQSQISDNKIQSLIFEFKRVPGNTFNVTVKARTSDKEYGQTRFLFEERLAENAQLNLDFVFDEVKARFMWLIDQGILEKME